MTRPDAVGLEAGRSREVYDLVSVNVSGSVDLRSRSCSVH